MQILNQTHRHTDSVTLGRSHLGLKNTLGARVKHFCTIILLRNSQSRTSLRWHTYFRRFLCAAPLHSIQDLHEIPMTTSARLDAEVSEGPSNLYWSGCYLNSSTHANRQSTRPLNAEILVNTDLMTRKESNSKESIQKPFWAKEPI